MHQNAKCKCLYSAPQPLPGLKDRGERKEEGKEGERGWEERKGRTSVNVLLQTFIV